MNKLSKLKVEYIPTNEVVPYDDNPRHNEEAVKYVQNSIKEFGFKNPIIIDKDNVIVAGHTRLKAATELNILEVPIIRADDLTEEQVLAFRLADNKVAEFSEWNFKDLETELLKIKDIEMSEFGMRESEFEFYDSEDLSDPESLLDDYEEPEKKQCQCPECGHIDDAKVFKI